MSGEDREELAEVLREHDYTLTLQTGAICLCGYIPPRDAGRMWSQQDWHRDHLAGVLAAYAARVRADALAPVLALAEPDPPASPYTDVVEAAFWRVGYTDAQTAILCALPTHTPAPSATETEGDTP